VVTSLADDRSRSAPVVLFSYRGGFFYTKLPDEQQPKAKTFHARHIINLRLDKNKNGILIADHGPDQKPFPGGKPLLLVKNKKNRWEDQSFRFPDLKAFTYQIAALDIDQDGADEIFFGNIFTPNSRPLFLKNDGRGFFKRKINLPASLSEGKICVMSLLPMGRQPDGTMALYLGGCDSHDQRGEVQANDHLLNIKSENLEVTEDVFLPPRKLDSSWGTAHLATADYNQDGRNDIVTVNHNWGFTKSLVQFYFQTGKSYVSENVKLPEEIFDGAFIPWVYSGDVNRDSKPDVLFPMRPNPRRKSALSSRLLLNVDGKSFSDGSVCIPQDEGDTLLAAIKDFNQDGQDDVFILKYSGQYKIVY
jgi:hypothetical protein